MVALLRKSFWGLVCLFLAGGLFAQKSTTFKVTGPCMACGTDRIIGIVKGLDGIGTVSYNASTSMLTVDFDPVSASAIDIQLELSVNGYDAGDFTHDAHAKLPDCARGGMRGDQAVDVNVDSDVDEPGIDDIEGLDGDTDWENPDSFELVGTSGDDDIDILDDEDLEDEDDLSTFVDEDGDGVAVPVDGDDEDEDDDGDDQ
jgi:hypothetical protein